MSPSPAPNDSSNDEPTPDPDIAGIGVIISFLITIAITFVLCIDLYWRKKTSVSSIVKRKVLLGFSDQLLVTGIGIQIAALIKISQLSIYHHNIVTTLATYSTFTHFLTLVLLKEYFQIHHLVRQIRLVIMSLSFVLILVNTIVAQIANMLCVIPISNPILEIFSPNALGHGGYTVYESKAANLYLAGFIMIYLDLALLVVFLYMVLSVLPPTEEEARIVKWLKAPIRMFPGFSRKVSPMFYVALPQSLIFASTFSLFLLQKFGLGHKGNDGASAESQWGYGQICSMLLLLIPVLNAISLYSEEWDNLNDRPGDGAGVQASVETTPFLAVATASGVNDLDLEAIQLQKFRRRDTEQRIGEAAVAFMPLAALPERGDSTHQD